MAVFGRGLVDEHPSGQVKHAPFSHPTSPCAGHVHSLLFRPQAFLRKGRRHGLEHEAEGLGAPMQIGDDPRAVADLVRRRARVDVIHSVT